MNDQSNQPAQPAQKEPGTCDFCKGHGTKSQLVGGLDDGVFTVVTCKSCGGTGKK